MWPQHPVWACSHSCDLSLDVPSVNPRTGPVLTTVAPTLEQHSTRGASQTQPGWPLPSSYHMLLSLPVLFPTGWVFFKLWSMAHIHHNHQGNEKCRFQSPSPDLWNQHVWRRLRTAAACASEPLWIWMFTTSELEGEHLT